MSKIANRYQSLKYMTYKDGLFYSRGKPTYDVITILETCYQQGLEDGSKNEDNK